MTFLSFAAPLFVYLLWPSCMWNFDGVACAAALELGNPVFFFHSNHLLYGFLGYGFWRLAALLGVHRALPALQLFNSLLAAGGLVGLYKMVEQLSQNPLSPSYVGRGRGEGPSDVDVRCGFVQKDPHLPFGHPLPIKEGERNFWNSSLALMIALSVSVTAVFWVWSLEAQVYALGFLAIAWATYWLLRADHPRRWRWAGLMHALAILGHVIHVLWVIPALYWLWKGEDHSVVTPAEAGPPHGRRPPHNWRGLAGILAGARPPGLWRTGAPHSRRPTVVCRVQIPPHPPLQKGGVRGDFVFARMTTERQCQNLKEYLLWLFCGVVVPYAFVIGLVILPHAHGVWFGQWLLGSAALGPGRSFQWHFPGWFGPYQWALTTLRVFWGAFWPYQNLLVSRWCWALTLLSALGFATLSYNSLYERRQALWRFSILWLAVYGLFFWTWEPGTECYRMTDVVPVVILMVLGLRELRSCHSRRGEVPNPPLLPPLQKGGAGGFCLRLNAGTVPARPLGTVPIVILLAAPLVSTFAVNFATRIYPMSQAARNTLYQQTMEISRRTPENSLYLTEGGQPWIYLLYFTGRPAWNIHSFASEPDRLAKAVAERWRRTPIYLLSSAIREGFIQSWLSRYKLQPVGGDLPWLQLR